ncbi:hypothetical protein Esti_005133 [Eimeria stiedai]
MKRARRRGDGGPSSSEGFLGGGRDFDAELLYRDDSDKKALESMNEFEREAELARRYEEVARERQRAELLSSAKDRKDGRLEALSDIRARRARMKQLQSKASDSSSNESGEEGEIRERENSEMDFSSDAEIPAPAEATTPHGPPRSAAEETAAELKSMVKKRSATRAEEGDASLFAEERLDFDEKRRRELSQKMLDRLSLELLNRVRLSTATIHHMLDHPQAEAYLVGCFVKVAPPAAAAAAAAAPDAFVCQIVGLKPCVSYTVKVDGSARSCTYTLVLRPTPKASSKYDREFTLAELIDSPATQREFESWLKKLQQFDTVEDLAKKMKSKIAQLEKFTFTDEDVQQILMQKQSASAAAAHTRGGLIKQALALKHQVTSMLATLSCPSTASSQRKDIKEGLALLLQKKAGVDAQLAKLAFDPLATGSRGSTAAATRATASNRLMQAARRKATAAAGVCVVADRAAAAASRGSGGPCGLQGLVGATREEQQKSIGAFLELLQTGVALAASIKPQPLPPTAFRGPMMVPASTQTELPTDCLVISLEEYKRQLDAHRLD